MEELNVDLALWDELLGSLGEGCTFSEELFVEVVGVGDFIKGFLIHC